MSSNLTWWFSKSQNKILKTISNSGNEKFKLIEDIDQKAAKTVLSDEKYSIFENLIIEKKKKDVKDVSLKDLNVLGDTSDSDEEILRKKRRVKKGDLEEALSASTRRKMALSFKKNKSKIARGRARAKKRIASQDVLKTRARRHARNILLKKMTKGVDKSDLSPARRSDLEKRLSKMGKKIEKIANRELKNVRKAELERKRK